MCKGVIIECFTGVKVHPILLIAKALKWTGHLILGIQRKKSGENCERKSTVGLSWTNKLIEVHFSTQTCFQSNCG